MLNYEFPPLGGGAGNATYYLLREFSKQRDLQIDLVTSSVGDYKEEQFADNIKIYYLDIGKKGNLHYQTNQDLLKYSWKAYWFSKKLIKENKYNLVHAFFGVPCGYIAMKLGLPYIVSLRGSDVPFYNKRFYWLDRIILKRLSGKIWRRARVAVANSEDLKNLALESSPDQKIEIINNGVDTSEFAPGQGEHEKFTILSTSRLIARKGVDNLLQAFILFRKKYNAGKLILVGQGNLYNQLLNKAEQNGVREHVDFVGAVKHEDIKEYYKQADIFVLASHNEGMSNSLLEAMASGLAIITTDTGGSRKILGNNCGLIIQYPSVQEILVAVERLYNVREDLIKFKDGSRNISLSFDWKKVAGKFLDIYYQILYENRPK